jgi:hypothetical protein
MILLALAKVSRQPGGKRPPEGETAPDRPEEEA